jgi:hypothetical protein
MVKPWLGLALVAATLVSVPHASNAMTIGYFDNSREQYGFSTGYLSGARQWLVDHGHTLVATNTANAAFLGSVDAFYTGLLSSVSNAEIAAMQSFVNNSGGFLFIQQDHDSGPWHAPSSQILANWGIGNSAGTFQNDDGHHTVGSSVWVTDPNAVNGFSGAAHSSVNVIPAGFETVAVDDAGLVILGVFDAGAGRSSDVFVATDIDFWSDGYGWTDVRNRNLWENIWTGATRQIEEPNLVPEPATLGLLAAGLWGLLRKRSQLTAARRA